MSAFHWKNAANGSFNTASAWIPSGIPGAADTAVIDAVGTYTVSSTVNNEVTELDTINTATLAITAGVFQVDLIANNYGTVSVHNGATLKLLSIFPFNAGKIMLGATSASTELNVGFDTFLAGGGRVTLSDSAKNVIDGGMLTNQDNTKRQQRRFSDTQFRWQIYQCKLYPYERRLWRHADHRSAACGQLVCSLCFALRQLHCLELRRRAKCVRRSADHCAAGSRHAAAGPPGPIAGRVDAFAARLAA
jgi:hypothetical protein